jgi:hypothetical protein
MLKLIAGAGVNRRSVSATTLIRKYKQAQTYGAQNITQTFIDSSELI